MQGPTRPLVVARRWDQLGGRLQAMVNAQAMAELFDLQFRFIWPRGADTAVNEPLQIFSPGYLEAFEIEPSVLEHRVGIPHHELLASSLPDARRRLECPDVDLFVEVNEVFDIVRGTGESSDAATERFRRCWHRIDWCEDLTRIVEARCPDDGLAAVHVRAGDIVEGSWRQTIVHEKYLPTAFIDHAVDFLTRDGDRKVLVLSDNRRYLGWLQERFPAVVTAAELVPGYAQLTEVQEAFVDILLLARCDPIVGPPSSAFSRLAANLGPGEIVRADRMVPDGSELEVLLAGIAERREQAAVSPWWRRLLARDICWCLDVFGESLPLSVQHDLAREAMGLDPDFSGAAARLARIAVIAGEPAAAEAAASRAREIAESVDSHSDPRFEALATEIAVNCLAVVRAGPRYPLNLPCPARFFPRWTRDYQRWASTALAESRDCIVRCRAELWPLWSERERVFDALELLMSGLQTLIDAPPAARRRTARALVEAPGDGAQLCLGGLADHRSESMYDPLRRDLDRMVLRLEAAVQQAGLALPVQLDGARGTP
jgi:hypothetical protein